MEHRHRKRGPHYFVTVRHASWQDNWVEKHQNQKSGISRYNIVARLSTDTNYHAQQYHLDLRKVETLLITHSHHDHFFPMIFA